MALVKIYFLILLIIYFTNCNYTCSPDTEYKNSSDTMTKEECFDQSIFTYDNTTHKCCFLDYKIKINNVKKRFKQCFLFDLDDVTGHKFWETIEAFEYGFYLWNNTRMNETITLYNNGDFSNKIQHINCKGINNKIKMSVLSLILILLF